MGERVEDWRARILLGGEVAGAGVLISAQHVLTCAHVVGNGEVPLDAGGPEAPVEVDFPLRRSAGRIRAQVVADAWFPALGEDGDIAVLELADPVAIPSAVLRPAAGRLNDRVRVVGYPAGYGTRGVGTSARIAETAAPESDWVYGELDQQAANPSGSGLNQHGLSRPQRGGVGQGEGSAPVRKQRHGLVDRQPAGDRDEPVGRDGTAFGITAMSAGGGDDAGTDEARVHADSSLGDHTADELPSTTGSRGVIAGLGGRPARTWVSTNVMFANATRTTT